MRLSLQEFRAMNNPVREFFLRTVELPNFRRLGLQVTGRDVLEIGCGSGYGATRLLALAPQSYVGIDLMPEQIALAHERALPQAAFMVQDAAHTGFAGERFDEIVIFGVLHHIEPWRAVVDECYRLLRPGGRLLIEEPDGGLLARWDQLFDWGHPASFTLDAFEVYCRARGLTISRQWRHFGAGTYCLRKPAQAAVDA